MNLKTLNSLPNGISAKIHSLTSSNLERRRMLDFGLIPGATVTSLYKSPSNNPIAYLIKGTVIALRNEDASKILIY